MGGQSVYTLRLIVLSTILILAAILTRAAVSGGTSNLQRKAMRDFPLDIDGWKGADQELSNGVLAKLGVDDYIMRRYTRDGDEFWLYIGYYQTQKGGKTIHSPKHCYPGSGWEKVDSTVFRIPVTGWDGFERTIPVNRYLLAKAGENELVYYWYQSADDAEASEARAAMARFSKAIRKGRTDGALVRISTRFRAERPDHAERIRDVVPIVYPLLKDFIPE